MAEAIRRFWILYQDKDMQNQAFHDNFKAIMSIIEEHSTNVALHTLLIALEQAEHGGDENDNKEEVLGTEELEE
eukprot:12248746-Ditylum_brightwellii.AAC.1